MLGTYFWMVFINTSFICDNSFNNFFLIVRASLNHNLIYVYSHVGGNNISELDHKCQNAAQSGSFIEMLEGWRRYMKALFFLRKWILYSQHTLANCFENETLNYVVILMI